MNLPHWTKPTSDYIDAINSFDFCEFFALAKFDFAQCTTHDEIENTKSKIYSIAQSNVFTDTIDEYALYYTKKVIRAAKDLEKRPLRFAQYQM